MQFETVLSGAKVSTEVSNECPLFVQQACYCWFVPGFSPNGRHNLIGGRFFCFTFLGCFVVICAVPCYRVNGGGVMSNRLEVRVSEELRTSFNGEAMGLRLMRNDVMSLLLEYFVEMSDAEKWKVFDRCSGKRREWSRRLVFTVDSQLYRDVKRFLLGKHVGVSRLTTVLIEMFCEGGIVLSKAWISARPRIQVSFSISKGVLKRPCFEQSLELAMDEHLVEFLSAIPGVESCDTHEMPNDVSFSKKRMKTRMKREHFEALKEAAGTKPYCFEQLVEGFVSTYVYPQ